MKLFIGIAVAAAAAWAASNYGVQTPIEARTLEDWIPVFGAGVVGLVVGVFIAPGGKPKLEQPIRQQSAEERDLVMMRQHVSSDDARAEAEPLLTSVEARLSALTPGRMVDSQAGIRAHAEASTLFERARAEASKPNRDTIDWVLVFFLLQQAESEVTSAESWAAPDPGDVAQAAAEPSANETTGAAAEGEADRNEAVEAADTVQNDEAAEVAGDADTTSAAETSARDDNADQGESGQTLNGHDSSGGSYGGGESYGGDSASASE